MFYLFFYGRFILRPWLTEVRESFTRGGPWVSIEKLLYLDVFLVILKLQGGPKSDEIWRIFRPDMQTFCSHPRTRQHIVILKKNLLSTDGCSTRNATFRELWRTNPWDPCATFLFLKSNRLQHVLFPFARWQHCWYCCTVGFDMYIRRTRLFLSRVSNQHTDARYWYSKSVCPFVCLSVRPSVTFRYQMKTA